MHKKTSNSLAQTIEDAPLEQLAHLLKWKHHVKIEKAFLFKDFADGLASAFDDNGVGIYIGAVEPFCQGASGAGFSACHESGEKDVLVHVSPAFLYA